MNKKIKTNKKIKEPLDGQPPKGAKASIKDFDYKVLFICRTSRSDSSQDGTFAPTDRRAALSWRWQGGLHLLGR